jgi:hypothetical protein
MATATKLDPLAEKALKRLQTQLESEEGRSASQKEILSALVFGATPAQTSGMLIAFTRVAARARVESKVTQDESKEQ